MYGKSARRSSLFLLELMISILMFSVASAWCVRLFVTARTIVSETEIQMQARNLATGYAELFLASEDFETFLLEEGARKEGMQANNLYCFFYNEDWSGCNEDEAVFYSEVMIMDEGEFVKCSFRFSELEGKDVIYLLNVEKYVGGEAVL